MGICVSANAFTGIATDEQTRRRRLHVRQVLPLAAAGRHRSTWPSVLRVVGPAGPSWRRCGRWAVGFSPAGRGGLDGGVRQPGRGESAEGRVRRGREQAGRPRRQAGVRVLGRFPGVLQPTREQFRDAFAGSRSSPRSSTGTCPCWTIMLSSLGRATHAAVGRASSGRPASRAPPKPLARGTWRPHDRQDPIDLPHRRVDALRT